MTREEWREARRAMPLVERAKTWRQEAGPINLGDAISELGEIVVTLVDEVERLKAGTMQRGN